MAKRKPDENEATGTEIVQANEQPANNIITIGKPLRGFTKPVRNGFYMPIVPRDWRFNAKDGFFSCDNEVHGDSITFRVIDWRIEQNILFSDVYKGPEEVVQAIIIDEKMVVGTIVFRTISMHEFLQMMSQLEINETAFATIDITATLEKTKTKKGYQFFIAKFGYTEGAEDYTNGIIEFIKQCPQVMECWRLLPTV